MRSLVTGGAGFIGSNLVKELIKKKHQVVVLDKKFKNKAFNLKDCLKKIEYHKIDISKSKKLDKFFYKVDYIFHLAALTSTIESIKKKKLYFKNNLEGTANLIKALKNKKIKKLVYAASASCYGNQKKFPIKESAKIKPQNPYATTKYRAENILIKSSNAKEIPVISLRLFNVYGKEIQNLSVYKSVINIFLEQKKKRKALTIFDDGNQSRDFIFVSDVVEAMIIASKSKFNKKIFNVASGKLIKIRKLAHIISNKKRYLPKRKGEIYKSLGDISSIKKHLNWKPKVSIKKGLNLLIRKY